MAPHSKRMWRPSHCQSRFATLYELASEPIVEKWVQQEKPAEVSQSEQPKVEQGKWCPGCMGVAWEPFTLTCGHTFCRRCFANTCPLLLQDYPEEVKDIRTMLKCPVSGCKNVVPCRPLINGDFRFWSIRPTDKVQLPEFGICEEEMQALMRYTLDVDVDLSLTSSSHTNLIRLNRIPEVESPHTTTPKQRKHTIFPFKITTYM